MDQHVARLRLVRARFLRLGLGLVLLSATAVAGDPASVANQPAALRPVASQAFGLQRADGVLWGGGPGYKARFDADGLQFTPALGRTAPRNLPLGLRTTSVSRGDTLLWSAATSATVEPSHADGRVSYARQPGLTERYDVRRDGLELSFLLETPPVGAGDLVVRLALDTELVAQPDGGGLRFAAEFGGVRLGAVTGIDADGRRVAGQARVVPGTAGSELELSLPAAFVSAARYPLVLDPEVTPIFPLLAGSSLEENAPDVSWDASVDRWLATWAQVFSINDIDIRAATLYADGTQVPFAYWFVEFASDTVALNPSVANLRQYNRWMIVWEQRPNAFASTDIRGLSISSYLGQSNTLVIAGTAADELHPDVGGHNWQQPAVVSVVWEAAGAILHRTIFLANDPVIDLAANIEVLAASGGTRPRISSSGGDSMRHLVAYEKWFSSPPPGDHDIVTVLVDVLGNVLTETNVTYSIGIDEHTPDVDGDGSNWAVAWAWSGAINWVNAVRVRRVFTNDGLSLGQAGLTLDFSGGTDDLEPSVACTGNGFLMSWARQYFGDDYDIVVVGLDSVVSAVVDPLTYVDVATTKARVPRLGARYASGHEAGDGALLAWETWDWQAGQGEVWGSLVEPLFGDVTDLGGGAPGGAHLSATSPKLGSAQFQHLYDGLYPFNQVTMIISPLTLNAPFCGGTLKVDTNVSIYFPLWTDANAGLTLVTPIPADAQLLGVTFYEQWSEKDVFTPPCGKKVQLSNALALKIE